MGKQRCFHPWGREKSLRALYNPVYTLSSSAAEVTLWLALRGEEERESWETEAGEIRQWARGVETANSSSPGVSLGHNARTSTHIQMLSRHTERQALAKQLSTRHKHYNQADRDSLSSLGLFIPSGPSVILAGLHQTTQHISTVQRHLEQDAGTSKQINYQVCSRIIPYISLLLSSSDYPV